MMNLGYIDYLNCYPLYYHMFEKKPLSHVRIHQDYPSKLNKMMDKGTLHMSPISAAAYADLADRIVLLSDYCISSVGRVQSVILTGNIPIEALHKKKVGLSNASHTSVVLLKIILRKYYGIEPFFVSTAPNPSLKEQAIDAALIIGNDAMMIEKAAYTYDLGELWLQKTGYPMVFAVVAVQESAIDSFSSDIYAVVDSYSQSLAYLETERSALIKKAKQKYPSIKSNIDVYYQLLQYSFTPILKEAFEFYLKSAGELGLLKEAGKLKFTTSPKNSEKYDT